MKNQYSHRFFDCDTPLTDAVFNTMPAVRVKQVHGNKVVKTDQPLHEWIEADAIVTTTPNLPIGVITADCAPVLFAGDGVVGAAHAGWQGALNGVLDNTVEAMAVSLGRIEAFIGPCISQKSYEVSEGFEIPFLEHDAHAERFFMEGAKLGKLHFDLAGYCAYRLALCGVRNVHIDGTDTLMSANYHSHRGGADGKERNLSAIMLT